MTITINKTHANTMLSNLLTLPIHVENKLRGAIHHATTFTQCEIDAINETITRDEYNDPSEQTVVLCDIMQTLR